MPRFKVTISAEAVIGEEWSIEAESEDAAIAAVLNGEGELIRDWVAGDETNRRCEDIEPLVP